MDYQIDGISFQLQQAHDLSWLRSFGRVFAVFSQNDSGNISFGVEKDARRYFIKVAGLKTMEAVRTPREAVAALKGAMPVYAAIKHPQLIELIDHFPLADLYIAVFKWAQGDCLFDHWNFDQYRADPQLLSPAARFKRLPLPKRLAAVAVVLSFLSAVAASGYVAVDFYDGSIMYDFATDTTTICDIDFYRKKPAINEMGTEFFGSKRLKAPEEYRYGAAIDEATNVFTAGALLCHFFGSYTEAQIRRMYETNAFFPSSPETWELNRACYQVVRKSVSPSRSSRYPTIAALQAAWQRALAAQ